MNLYCPHCHKMLQVPDQSAGQRMRCPLCNGEFNAPALPQSAPPPAPSFPAASTPAPPPPFPPTSAPAGGTYGLAGEAKPSPPPFTPPSSMPPPVAAKPQAAEPPAPAPAKVETKTEPTAGGKPCCAITLPPTVFDWLPVACFIAILFLTLLPWVRYAPGGESYISQNAWFAAFNMDLWSEPDKLKWEAREFDEKETPVTSQLNMNGWTLIYLLLLLASIVVGTACAVFPLVRPKLSLKIPPVAERFLPWRSGLVLLLALGGILFLSMQIVVGFSLENQLKDRFEKREDRLDKALKDVDKDKKEDFGMRNNYLKHVWRDGLRRTTALTLVYLLQFLAIVTSALSLWLTIRGDRPPMRAVFYG